MALAPPSQHIDVLEMNEVFEEVDGSFQFTGTLVVYRAAGDLYHALSKTRYSSASEIRTAYLTNNILIPVSAYSPPFLPHFTRAPEPLLCDYYVKKPRLISYDRICQGSRPNHIADSILSEVEVCEVLKRNPHPNIAKYLGCQVSGGKITGICFAKYHSTLMQTVNPGNLMKRKFKSLCQKTEALSYSHLLNGVESGIRHLHSLGFVHNDINPSNIMLHNNTSVIIDFGSCRPVGKDLEGIGRTYEWYNETIQVSTPKNDLDALEEMRTWLGDGSKEFHFAE